MNKKPINGIIKNYGTFFLLTLLDTVMAAFFGSSCGNQFSIILMIKKLEKYINII